VKLAAVLAISLASPNGLVGLEFARDEANRLVYTVTLGRDVTKERK